MTNIADGDSSFLGDLKNLNFCDMKFSVFGTLKYSVFATLKKSPLVTIKCSSFCGWSADLLILCVVSCMWENRNSNVDFMKGTNKLSLCIATFCM